MGILKRERNGRQQAMASGVSMQKQFSSPVTLDSLMDIPASPASYPFIALWLSHLRGGRNFFR